MTFTSTTIRKLRALNLDQATFDAVLEIFEEAKESKPKKKGDAADRTARGTRLPEDWTLPAEWRAWALAVGLHPFEVDREAKKMHRWALNATGLKGVKLRWDLTWQNWCEKMLVDAGRQPRAVPKDGGGSAPASGPEAFTDETWRAIAKRVKAGTPWNPEWGPPPGRMDCKMPDAYL